MADTYKRIGSVQKACAILDYFGRQKSPVSGKTVAAELGQPHGTVMCYLTTLADEGFLIQINDRFRLGPKLAVFWARTKAQLESDRIEIDRKLDEIRI